MLVLSRKLNQEILIGDNIVVRVISIRGNQVRLGIVAPRDVPVLRDELLTKIPATPRQPCLGTRPLKCARC
ncbi:MAG: carbon storage regulator CsrA [Planctomycetia bacterium]|nr:carbon storage regulator CsrA [Planctomycetia bacterium]